MKKLLLWQLLIPLLIASGLTFGIAYLLNNTLDYPSIFLNLSTDFIMVVITIWYVDRVLKRHEDEKWKDVDLSIKYKIYDLANSAIETICIPIGIHDESLPEFQEVVNKLKTSQTPGIDTDYYGDFAKKFVAGRLNHTPRDTPEDKFAIERLKKVNISEEGCRKIYKKLKKYERDATQIIDFFGTRLTAEQLKALMNFQFFIQGHNNRFNDALAKNEWWSWYQFLFLFLPQCLDLLDASSLHWTIVAEG
ncbi:MAG: hypothetical protein HY864_10920 [Chloroflexi bacterium]|nr:hypothetical protein [Chloroflexota bacterium]